MTTELNDGPVDLYSLAEAYAEFKERCDELEAMSTGKSRRRLRPTMEEIEAAGSEHI